MKKAHIILDGSHQPGDEVLGICGKTGDLEVLNADIPKSKPICRKCVDKAVATLKESCGLIDATRISARRLSILADVISQELNADLIFDEIAAAEEDHEMERVKRIADAEELELRLRTCTCTWTTQEIFTVDPQCPIHGGHSDAIGVELTKEEEQ
jgi:hypothetical protein